MSLLVSTADKGFPEWTLFFLLVSKVRISLLLLLLLLSEGAPSSDSFSRISASPVRRGFRFGPIFSDFCFFCPKMLQVRTHSPGFLLLLSEGASGSDSFSRISASSVRRCSKFGLTRPDFCFSCPKGLQVRTLSLRFLLLLSEGASGSDSAAQVYPFSVQM